ncbi:unnamed protein product [Cyprideis torosa]|uniref:Uncharacterized protein n=1 Tax=Cyprideis torosa TaxID=163714 RepID=A0A7R8ZT89_9CRUS|nr:unnamed protein product [Cyprideis torosa]CAG0903432.1 unnamed protein product [Cyprideis torosa]
MLCGRQARDNLAGITSYECIFTITWTTMCLGEIYLRTLVMAVVRCQRLVGRRHSGLQDPHERYRGAPPSTLEPPRTEASDYSACQGSESLILEHDPPPTRPPLLIISSPAVSSASSSDVSASVSSSDVPHSRREDSSDEDPSAMRRSSGEDRNENALEGRRLGAVREELRRRHRLRLNRRKLLRLGRALDSGKKVVVKRNRKRGRKATRAEKKVHDAVLASVGGNRFGMLVRLQQKGAAEDAETSDPDEDRNTPEGAAKRKRRKAQSLQMSGYILPNVTRATQSQVAKFVQKMEG